MALACVLWLGFLKNIIFANYIYKKFMKVLSSFEQYRDLEFVNQKLHAYKIHISISFGIKFIARTFLFTQSEIKNQIILIV